MVFYFVFTFKVGIYNIVFKVSLSIAVRDLSTQKQISPLPLLSKMCRFQNKHKRGRLDDVVSVL